MYCSYYQAHVKRPTSWFVVAALKSFEHMAFDRTIDVATSTFEFFVPQDTEKYFLKVMSYLQKNDYIEDLRKLPNRLELALSQQS